jgi:16S rRNA (guanine527-N7)-methyltransferase
MEKLKQDALSLFGLRLTAQQVGALQTYEQELLTWNARFNLTAIRDSEAIHAKHFLDSFSCLQVLKELTCTRMIDIGTGAGFPGIPLKIILPKMRLTLVESVGKKADFCRHVVETLKLEGVTVLTGRAEEVGQMLEHRQQYDWAVARAVAVMPVLAEYLLPLVRVGGRVLAQKGETGPAETQTAEHAIRVLGGRLRQLVRVTLPGVADERYLVVIDKIAATPPQFPRRVGLPAKKPINSG